MFGIAVVDNLNRTWEGEVDVSVLALDLANNATVKAALSSDQCWVGFRMNIGLKFIGSDTVIQLVNKGVK